MYTSYSLTILAKLITSKRCGLLTVCKMLAIIFWIIQKTYRLHVTCWNESGRKLPTAFNSQQLLRWLRPKRYIFSIFLVNKKLKKICSNSQQEKWSVTIWHYSKRLPKSCRKYEILDTKKSSFVTSRIVLFGLFRKVQKSTKYAKSAKITKIAKICKICKISKKYDFLLSEGYHTWSVRIAVWTAKIAKSRLFAKVQISEILCPNSKNHDFAKSQKSRKFSDFPTCKKIEKVCCMPWRSMIANGGIFHSSEAKKTHFFALFFG